IELIRSSESFSAIVQLVTGTEGDAAVDESTAVEGTLAALRFARREGIPRVVHVSSMSAYGDDARAADGWTAGLEKRPELRGPYARGKILAERAIVEFVQTDGLGGMEFVILRPGLVFGPGMKDVLAGTAVQLPLGIAVGL